MPSDTPKPSELSRTQEIRREHIVQAALLVFERDGFEAARMIDIADEAGVAKGTLYLYFENKAALLEGVIQTEVLPTIQAVGDAIEDFSGSARDVLKNQIRTTAERMASPGMKILLKLMISSGGQNPHIPKFYYENVLEPGVQLFRRTLELGVETGEFKEDVLDLDPVTLVGAHVYTGVWNILFSEYAPLDIDAVIDGFTGTVMNGLLVTPDLKANS
ncbi:MAG: TetR family transcriptional regulator [Henriciella sp.]